MTPTDITTIKRIIRSLLKRLSPEELNQILSDRVRSISVDDDGNVIIDDDVIPNVDTNKLIKYLKTLEKSVRSIKFDEPNGGMFGRILSARDGIESIIEPDTRHEIEFIDSLMYHLFDSGNSRLPVKTRRILKKLISQGKYANKLIPPDGNIYQGRQISVRQFKRKFNIDPIEELSGVIKSPQQIKPRQQSMWTFDPDIAIRDAATDMENYYYDTDCVMMLLKANTGRNKGSFALNYKMLGYIHDVFKKPSVIQIDTVYVDSIIWKLRTNNRKYLKRHIRGLKRRM